MVDDRASRTPPDLRRLRGRAVSEPVAEFQQAVTDLDDCYRRGVRAFAVWFAKEWQITPEQWRHDYAEEPPGGEEWFRGHNTGVEGALMAVDQFLDEYMPR